jgi:hypothetical protein
MDLPFCKICGENHRLGHCPLWDEPPPQRKPDAKPVPREDEKIAESVEEKSPASLAQEAWHQAFLEARPLSPEDMKQEEMPDIKPRFDRNAYQRELMRKRAGSKRDERCL